jgi:mRNA-degrading endonuclease RelE of RelBE toxin-antitoxin system
MTSYNLALSPSASRALGALPSEDKERLTDALHEVAEREQPTAHSDVEHLRGDRQGRVRLRVGDWRAILELDKPRLLVHTIGHRGGVYND